VPAAGGRHVVEDLAAAPGYQADQSLSLSARLGGGISATFMTVPDSGMRL